MSAAAALSLFLSAIALWRTFNEPPRFMQLVANGARAFAESIERAEHAAESKVEEGTAVVAAAPPAVVRSVREDTAPQTAPAAPPATAAPAVAAPAVSTPSLAYPPVPAPAPTAPPVPAPAPTAPPLPSMVAGQQQQQRLLRTLTSALSKEPSAEAVIARLQASAFSPMVSRPAPNSVSTNLPTLPTPPPPPMVSPATTLPFPPTAASLPFRQPEAVPQVPMLFQQKPAVPPPPLPASAGTGAGAGAGVGATTPLLVPLQPRAWEPGNTPSAPPSSTGPPASDAAANLMAGLRAAAARASLQRKPAAPGAAEPGEVLRGNHQHLL